MNPLGTIFWKNFSNNLWSYLWSSLPTQRVIFEWYSEATIYIISNHRHLCSLVIQTKRQKRTNSHLICNHFLEKCRKVVLEKGFCKLGFFFWSTTFLQPEKKVDLWYKTTFFFGQPLFSNQISRTRFLKLLFSKHFSTLF